MCHETKKMQKARFFFSTPTHIIRIFFASFFFFVVVKSSCIHTHTQIHTHQASRRCLSCFNLLHFIYALSFSPRFPLQALLSFSPSSLILPKLCLPISSLLNDTHKKESSTSSSKLNRRKIVALPFATLTNTHTYTHTQRRTHRVGEWAFPETLCVSRSWSFQVFFFLPWPFLCEGAFCHFAPLPYTYAHTHAHTHHTQSTHSTHRAHTQAQPRVAWPAPKAANLQTCTNMSIHTSFSLSLPSIPLLLIPSPSPSPLASPSRWGRKVSCLSASLTHT